MCVSLINFDLFACGSVPESHAPVGTSCEDVLSTMIISDAVDCCGVFIQSVAISDLFSGRTEGDYSRLDQFSRYF
jgi:hypothetical protein